ncbi:MAG: hypothetical protein RIA63_08175 [Cyclobacteriaceae bacterium]
MSLLKQINRLIALPKTEKTPLATFWKGAFLGLYLLCLIVMVLSGLFFRTGIPPWIMAVIALTIGVIAFWLFRVLGFLLHRLIVRIPAFIFALLIAAISTFTLALSLRSFFPLQNLFEDLTKLFTLSSSQDVFYTWFSITSVCFIFLFGSVLVLATRASKSKAPHLISIIASITIIFIGLFSFSFEGTDAHSISFQQTPTALISQRGLGNPGDKGSYQFQHFTYGSGADLRREEFKTEIKFKTPTVNASRLLPEWKGTKAKWRELYWGFGVKEFPLNGRVWMPIGEGKFPIVLIVHGNHGMEEHSDPGYTYLGELLSSRGFIAVSVDENFINGTWSGDFRGKEMPARGWLLLKHLEQWRNWSNDKKHELYQKADLTNVSLIGHSRGGEAAPIAAHFNTLEYYPGDANEKFDFNFGIKGIVAIAPTDKRYERRIKLENISYFSIQGSYDSDEASFFGMRQYQRVSFTDSLFHFKAGLYVHGANHGQFNSVWGKYDGGPPGRWLLNTAPLMTIQEQQQIAKVYISAFAEMIFNNEKYDDLFKNSASASNWLPDKIMVNNYKDSNTKSLVNFEEDIDLTTGSVPGAQTKGVNLKLWKESQLRFRDDDTQGKNAAILGWDKDSTETMASYQITFQSSINTGISTSLLISMARGNPEDLKSKKGDSKEENSNTESSDLNFQIQLIDSLGNEAVLDISAIKKLTPRLEIQYLKLKGLSKENYGSLWEPTLETFELPIHRFTSPAGALHSIKFVKFNFNRSERGVLILDEVAVIH